jgi:hypothetical protein
MQVAPWIKKTHKLKNTFDWYFWHALIDIKKTFSIDFQNDLGVSLIIKK